MNRIFLIPLFVAAALSWIATQRADFSLAAISAPIGEKTIGEAGEDVLRALKQPYRYLGEGRQAFVFESQDKRTVLKFFKKAYFAMPWYARLSERIEEKRIQRETFYRNSYAIAQQFLKKETGLIFVHLEKSEMLPQVVVADKASRLIPVDLNSVPFVLQKKGEPMKVVLAEIFKSKGSDGLILAIDAFIELIAKRISLGIADADHDVMSNFGFIDGNLANLDPGRLYFDDLLKKERLAHEWWSSTHAMRKWLLREHPEVVKLFDEKLNRFSQP